MIPLSYGNWTPRQPPAAAPAHGPPPDAAASANSPDVGSAGCFLPHSVPCPQRLLVDLPGGQHGKSGGGHDGSWGFVARNPAPDIVPQFVGVNRDALHGDDHRAHRFAPTLIRHAD